MRKPVSEHRIPFVAYTMLPLKGRPRYFYDGEGRVWIYGLVDPFDGSLRYIGVTNDLDRRLAQHMQAEQARPEMREWIKALAAVGARPLLARLGSSSPASWKSAEVRWIAFVRRHGALYNSARGGAPGWKQRPRKAGQSQQKAELDQRGFVVRGRPRKVFSCSRNLAEGGLGRPRRNASVER